MGSVTAETVFPVHLLEGSGTALVLFAAAFGGENDAAHIWDAGLDGTCVDVDSAALFAMTGAYPGWTFAPADAFDYARAAAAAGKAWDVVTLDPFTGDTMDRVIESLPVFCALARNLVVAGTDGREITAPDGWRVHSKSWRSSRAYWTNLVPC